MTKDYVFLCDFHKSYLNRLQRNLSNLKFVSWIVFLKFLSVSSLWFLFSFCLVVQLYQGSASWALGPCFILKMLECQCLNLGLVRVENSEFILIGFSTLPISVLDLWAVFHLQFYTQQLNVFYPCARETPLLPELGLRCDGLITTFSARVCNTS